MGFASGRAFRLSWAMKTIGSRPVAKWIVMGAAALVLAALTGLVFAMWLQNGAGIFLALAQSGLAWCL